MSIPIAKAMPSLSRVPRAYLLALAVSAVLGIAILPTRGQYRADSMALVFVALGLVVWQVVDFVRATPNTTRLDVARIGMQLVFIAFIVVALVDQKLLQKADSWPSLRLVLVVELALVASYLRDGRDPPTPADTRWPRIRFALFGLCIAVGMLETVRLVPAPDIDVWRVQMAGARAILDGQNPFQVVSVESTTPGCELVPYVYPPLQALVTAPALLLGDVRFTMCVALLVFGVAVRDLTARSGCQLPQLLIDAPALVVWLSPKLFFIVEQAWIDPVQCALIASAAALAMRKRTWLAAILFGFVLASKQTMFWVAPLAYVAIPEFRLRHALGAITIAVAAYAPFALWDLDAFRYATFGLLANLPERTDALSFTNWAMRVLHVRIPYAIAFPLAGAVVLYAMLRRRAQPHVFGIALFITYFIFFTVNKWTFANYYFSILSMAAVGAALSLYEPGSQPRTEPASAAP